MDINEIKGNNFHRHPWELSRTRSVIKDILRFIDIERDIRYINIGAGDLFFDEIFIEQFAPKSNVVAVDIGYEQCEPGVWDKNKCRLYSNIEEVDDNEFDFAIMMDSLEYIPEDCSFIKNFSNMIKSGGYMIFTVPAFSSIYSEYDTNVGNIRRYSKDEFEKVISQIDGVNIEYSHYFYFSLFVVRIIQKTIGIKFAAHEDVTTQWKYSEGDFITKLVIAILNIDYAICKMLRKAEFPGLSLLVVCKKK
ncbi:class I SAM-dependent methyltransferase [Butyrivibrio sp. AE2032]|uniref:class I SAM-dependent methyltransferase n=1 Tax=Butyrivibrio sp. AE2032 TaxID=1458463 RepID=UPI00054D1993|nr:methyltransferase domain-containing protein [Butyrivibrio sp. AE2032]